MLADARRRHFDVVACTALDRLARSVRQLSTVGEELAAVGVDLCVLRQAIDTSTPTGRLLFHTLSAVAEFERDLIRERTAEGRRRSGKRGGRPRALDTDKRQRLARLLSSGQSQRYIADMLGVSKATVTREVTRLRAEQRLRQGER
jgi:DNA invertase Pin-like site-specific DNA recombinase